jgi:hypothetical protein
VSQRLISTGGRIGLRSYRKAAKLRGSIVSPTSPEPERRRLSPIFAFPRARARDSCTGRSRFAQNYAVRVSEFVRKTNWPVLRSTASQTQLGFQSALIVQRLRGQGYGDSPDAVFHSFSTAHIHNRLSDTIECSQPLPKNFNPKFSTLSIQKHYPTPEWCAGCSQPLVGVMTTSQHVYEVRPRKDHRGAGLLVSLNLQKGIGLRSNVQLSEAVLNPL